MKHPSVKPLPPGGAPPPFAPLEGANDIDMRASGECLTVLTVEEAYRRYGRQVLRAIRGRNVGPHSAEELLHDVYLLVIQMNRREVPLLHGLATLLAIAKRLLANYRRNRRRRPRPGWEIDAAEMADTLETGNDDAADAHWLVQAALERMDPDDRELIRQVQIEGISPAEIAAALGCSVKTVWTRYGRAKDRLVALLMALDEDPPPDARAVPERSSTK